MRTERVATMPSTRLRVRARLSLTRLALPELDSYLVGGDMDKASDAVRLGCLYEHVRPHNLFTSARRRVANSQMCTVRKPRANTLCANDLCARANGACVMEIGRPMAPDQ